MSHCWHQEPDPRCKKKDSYFGWPKLRPQMWVCCRCEKLAHDMLWPWTSKDCGEEEQGGL